MRRTVTLVAGQDPAPKSKAKLWAYGLDALAKAAGCHISTVRRYIQSGQLDPCDLRSVAGWLSKIDNDLAHGADGGGN